MPILRRCLRPASRRASLPLPLLLVLSLGALAAAAPAPHHPSRQLPASREAGTAGHYGPGALSSAQAARLAERTGRRVTVSALTTPTSSTTVSPRGMFTVTESALPVRAWRGGRWQPLSARLGRQRNGTIAPAVTTNGLALSGGGTGPVAVLDSGGRTVSLAWPGPLPVPTLSGPAATYANVLPGVDLVITADDQGGFSDVLVVHSAAAAGNPALASIHITAKTQGLVLAADAAGNLTATAGPGAAPVITSQAPQIWDSAPPPAGMPTVTSPDGTILNANNGLPAYSSMAAPGSAAHLASIPVALSGTTITLTPPASVLTGPGITYPVYIDPTWHNVASTQATKWTQVDSGFPTTSYWMENSDLQVGDCYNDPGTNDCQGLGVARSFIRWPIPSQLTSTTDVHQAFLYMTENWAPSCTTKSVRLYTTTPIDSSTTWNHQPTWPSSYTYQDAAFGHDSSCPYYKNDITWDVTSTIAADAGTQGYQTWGLRAANETDTLGWKKFKSGGSNLTLSVIYNYPPNKPDRTSSPGGDCYYSATGAPVIGNDSVTFSASASDNDGDNNLTTEFIILNSTGAPVYDTAQTNPVTNVVTGNNATANLNLSQATMQGLTAGATYHWYALTTDDFGLTSKQPTDYCYFTYNPAAPGPPSINPPSGTGTFGGTVAVTFTAPAGCGGTSSPCPSTYSYQLGASPPVTVNADGSHNWSGNITVNQVGPMQLTAYGISTGGNLSPAATAQYTGTKPANAYQDGYFTGPANPDLLTVGTSGKHSLWLSVGTGNGSLGTPVDIGSLGTGNSPGSDGPGDWANTEVLHGNFTGHGVQDVIAYNSASGTGEVIAGNGIASSLIPSPPNVAFIASGQLADNAGNPGPLAAAGNASQIGTGTDDLIGISGTGTTGAELDLYTSGQCGGCGTFGGYAYLATLSLKAPGGDSWQNYSLATVQPGCHPGSTTCNPSATVLFALDNTGALYESVNPSPGVNCLNDGTDYTQAGCTIIGTPHSTWSGPLGVPWGASPPLLASADINASGQTELWTVAGSTATAYTLSGGTLTKEGSGSSLAEPSDEWPLTDGSDYAQGSGATTATDVTGGNDATIKNGASWTSDEYFGATITPGGAGYLTPSAGTVPVTSADPTLSVWFKTTTAGGVIASLQGTALAPGGTSTTYDPVLYVGTDGYLYAQWYTGHVAPLISNLTGHAILVNDGQWHHAILATTGSGTGTTQTLTVDGVAEGSLTSALKLQGDSNGNTYLTFGAGYMGGNWPAEPNQGNTGIPDYYQGQITDITFAH